MQSLKFVLYFLVLVAICLAQTSETSVTDDLSSSPRSAEPSKTTGSQPPETTDHSTDDRTSHKPHTTESATTTKRHMTTASDYSNSTTDLPTSVSPQDNNTSTTTEPENPTTEEPCKDVFPMLCEFLQPLCRARPQRHWRPKWQSHSRSGSKSRESKSKERSGPWRQRDDDSEPEEYVAFCIWHKATALVRRSNPFVTDLTETQLEEIAEKCAEDDDSNERSKEHGGRQRHRGGHGKHPKPHRPHRPHHPWRPNPWWRRIISKIVNKYCPKTCNKC